MRLDHFPGAIVAPAFDGRRLQGNAGCRRGVVRLGVRILDPSGQAEHETVLGREPAEPITEIEDDPVFLGVADPAGPLAELVRGHAIPMAKRLGQVAAFEVKGSDWLDLTTPGQHFTGRPRTFRCEPLVRSGRDPGRPVDHFEPGVVEVSDLVHGLGDRQSEGAVDRPELIAGDCDRLVAVGLAVDPRCDQVAKPPTAQEVTDADETSTVPREKHGATAGLAIPLIKVELLICRRHSTRTAIRRPAIECEQDRPYHERQAQGRLGQSIGPGRTPESCVRR